MRENLSLLGAEDLYASGQDELGSIFGSLKKAFKKTVGKLAKKGMAAVAKVAGPAVATMVPGSGPFIAAGIKVLKDSQKGTPQKKAAAKAKIASVKIGAAKGNPKAIRSLDALMAAQEVINQSNPPTRMSTTTDGSAPSNLVVSVQTGQHYLLIPTKR